MKKKVKSRVAAHSSLHSLKKTAFLFYGSDYTPENILHITESIKHLKKDYREMASFFLLDIPRKNEGLPNKSLLAEEDLHVMAPGENILSVPDNAFDYLVILKAGGMAGEIKFNNFFVHQDAFPQAGSWSEIFFEDQPPASSGGIILERKLAVYLAELPAHTSSGLKDNVLWHLRRMNLRTEKFFTSVGNPYQDKPSKLRRPTSPLPALRRWTYWNFSRPISEFRTGQHPAFLKESPAWRPLFIAGILLTMVILPLISFHAGISGDEEKHWLQAEKVYNYFASGGQDTLALTDRKYKLNYYGQSFDLFTYVFIKTFHIENIYETRHVLNGFIGALTIVATAFLVRLLLGNAAGLLSIFLLFFSPRFLGHAMNNPLDIPFALGYIFTLLQTIRFLKRLPEFSWKTAALIAVGIAFTISIRIGGLILIPYLFLFSFLFVIYNKWPWKFMSAGYKSFLRKGLVFLVVISLAAYFLSILPWPYALRAPLKNPFNSLKMMSNITVSLKVMFEGKIIWSDHLPWYYIPKNILITVPLVILFFFVIPLFTFYRHRHRVSPFWIFILYFAALFPVAYIIYKGSNVYGGWRHVLFVYPPLVVLSTAGIIWLRDAFSNRYARTGLVIAVILLMTGPVVHIFRNFPLQYIYYNQLVGGVDKAYKKYETDYYLVSLKPGTEWIKKDVLPGRKEKTTIISNAPSATIAYYFRHYSDTVSLPYTRYYDRGMQNWDYAVYFMNYIDPYQIRHDIWPPKNTIHEVKVDDVPVCAVVKRENRDDYYGIKKLNEGIRAKDASKIVEGIKLLEKAINYDKYNEIAYMSAAQGYILVGGFSKARSLLHQLMGFYPNYDKALNLIGYSYLTEGNIRGNPVLTDRAITVFNQVIAVNFKNSQAYYNLGLAYMMKGDDNEALKYFQESLRLNSRFKDAYLRIANILEKKGDRQQAELLRKQANSL
ncbi:MAG TPA: tetratricopeptide repeat protein [Bacteroidales bacterium]|nr:tetratricopeptide repeat protein [Bacteroidales bacterium]